MKVAVNGGGNNNIYNNRNHSTKENPKRKLQSEIDQGNKTGGGRNQGENPRNGKISPIVITDLPTVASSLSPQIIVSDRPLSKAVSDRPKELNSISPNTLSDDFKMQVIMINIPKNSIYFNKDNL